MGRGKGTAGCRRYDDILPCPPTGRRARLRHTRLGGRGRTGSLGEAEDTTAGGLRLWPSARAGCHRHPGKVWAEGREPQDLGDMTRSCRTRPPRGGCAALTRLGGRGRIGTVGDAERVTAVACALGVGPRGVPPAPLRVRAGERSGTGAQVEGPRRVRFTAPPAPRAVPRGLRAEGSGREPQDGYPQGGGDHDGRRLAPLAVGPRRVPPAPRQGAGRGPGRVWRAGGWAA
jgi:hypothetical protein